MLTRCTVMAMLCDVDLLKVLYMNAQYLIVHICVAKTDGVLDSQYGVDCVEGTADVKIYGRTAVITESVRLMLVDIAKPRSCVDLDHMQYVKQNGASSPHSIVSYVQGISFRGF